MPLIIQSLGGIINFRMDSEIVTAFHGMHMLPAKHSYA